MRVGRVGSAPYPGHQPKRLKLLTILEQPRARNERLSALSGFGLASEAMEITIAEPGNEISCRIAALARVVCLKSAEALTT